MKSLRHFLLIVCVLVPPLSRAEPKPGPAGSDQRLSTDKKERESIAAQTLNEGRATGSLPAGVVIRISACLGASDAKASGGRVPDEMREMWEFTSRQVHRIEVVDKNATSTYERAESRPFATKNICKELLEGKAIELEARKGKGPEVGFVGTNYHLGSRLIEVLLNGKTILELHESNTAVLDLYRESDARAFGALYERLASQARGLFQSPAVEVRKR